MRYKLLASTAAFVLLAGLACASAQTMPDGAGSGAAAQQDQSRTNIMLNAEQRTKVREMVLAQSDLPRLTSINFSINVGSVLPPRVRLVAVPAALTDINPAFRYHQFFLLRDEIIIVDNGRRIVAVIPSDGSSGPRQAGGSGAEGRGGQPSATTGQGGAAK
jgi:hypothetical protein